MQLQKTIENVFKIDSTIFNATRFFKIFKVNCDDIIFVFRWAVVGRFCIEI